MDMRYLCWGIVKFVGAVVTCDLAFPIHSIYSVLVFLLYSELIMYAQLGRILL
jgi:hypothetical protein